VIPFNALNSEFANFETPCIVRVKRRQNNPACLIMLMVYMRIKEISLKIVEKFQNLCVIFM
jgi:hypothetical protein